MMIYIAGGAGDLLISFEEPDKVFKNCKAMLEDRFEDPVIIMEEVHFKGVDNGERIYVYFPFELRGFIFTKTKNATCVREKTRMYLRIRN
jgi:hypothetical protein